MKTIKIIDLLNKIANGEEVPVKIRIGALYMYWDGNVYWDEDGESQFCEVIESSEYSLNREVEIIEEALEEKEGIDRINIAGGISVVHCAMKINELIDVVNELKRDK